MFFSSFSLNVTNVWTPRFLSPFHRRWNPTNPSLGGAREGSHVTSNNDGPEPRVLSKKRRDLINAEIRELQNLLPLKKSARERLSYLGILALTNTYIRKATFFKNGWFLLTERKLHTFWNITSNKLMLLRVLNRVSTGSRAAAACRQLAGWGVRYFTAWFSYIF